MITYSIALSTLQQLSGVPTTDTTNSALLIQFWNDSRRTVAAMRGGNWPWLEIEKTVDTVADQNYIYVPNSMRKVTAVRAVVGSGTSATIYLPRLLYDAQKYQMSLAMRLGSNQYPYFAYQEAQKLLLVPTPSVTGTHITMIGRRAVRDVGIADYSNGNILTATNASTAIVGTGTTWTVSMAGRYIRITESDSANKGDGYWYEIASVESATTLTLVKPYEGTAITAGSAAYLLGQITYEPEAYQMAPVYRALAQYWDFKEDKILSKGYWMQYDGGKEANLVPAGSQVGGIIGQMLEEANETFDGAYIPPSEQDFMGLFQSPYYYPWQDASGFN